MTNFSGNKTDFGKLLVGGFRSHDLRIVAFTAALLCGFAAPSTGAAEPVALTFDDLPVLSLSETADYARTTMRRLVTGLRRHDVPATGFVVGDKLEAEPKVARAMLRQWLSAGLELGNHTYSHESLNTMSAPDYVADIAHEDGLLRKLLSQYRQRPHWFRHPYLETGATEADRKVVEVWLAAHGYRIAPVTLENSDDIFAFPYDQAVLAGDTLRADQLRAEYLAFTERSIVWYRQAARDLLGRHPALIFLLHASRLNADSLDDILRILRRHHLRPAPLGQAMRDPAYKLPDGPPDKDGDDWLNRWAGVLHAELPWDKFPEPPEALAEQNRRLDVEP